MTRNRPFDHNYFIGYINQVFPDCVMVHFPSSVLLKKFVYTGEEFNAGLVGNYVTIEGENHGFLGKILQLSLPEKERIGLNEKAFQNKEFHPIGKIEILLGFDYFSPEKVKKGLSAYPNIGSKVFVCSSEFIQQYFKGFGVNTDMKDAPTFDFGTLTSDSGTSIEVSQQALFGRHCAIVGTTGGGKSWTVSKCLEETIKNDGKAIIIDATGEYSPFDGQDKIDSAGIIGVNSFLHYSNLTVDDLFVLLRPSGQVQAPKLLEAIKSLKIVGVLEKNVDGVQIIKNANGTFNVKHDADGTFDLISVQHGNIIKSNGLHRPFNKIYYRFIDQIESAVADFDIKRLAHQLYHECVWEIGRDVNRWGDRQDTHYNNCISLILRVNNLIQNSQYAKIFGINSDKNSADELTKRIATFLESETKHLLRVSFEKVGYDFQSREILANAIGKFLLGMARNDVFKNAPLILFIDEAHQYLNKHVKDEYFEMTQLNAFDQIAKECRKYGLFLCLATQMPRDIPTGTLSQMGTFIVHRLINPYDKEAVENACSTANKNSLDFLPILGEGEAILMGIDFPMPVILKLKKPVTEPNSKTPQFKRRKKTKIQSEKSSLN